MELRLTFYCHLSEFKLGAVCFPLLLTCSLAGWREFHKERDGREERSLMNRLRKEEERRTPFEWGREGEMGLCRKGHRELKG